MKPTKSIKFLLPLLMLLVVMPLSFAFFIYDHRGWTLIGFNEVDSSITSQCREYLPVVLDGNTGADVPVLHYFDDKFMSYVSTHTRGSGWEACKEIAGSDMGSRCFCMGMALHIIQDSYSHNEGGLVPTYLKQDFSSNLLGHMTVEKDFENKHIALWESRNQDIVTNGVLEYHDENVCNTFFEESGGDYKYVELLNELIGMDVRNDLNLFCNGYKNQGFYQTVYNEKLKLPWWFYGLSWGALILGIGVAYLAFLIGKTNWKYALMAMYVMVALVGGIVLYAFYTGQTWEVVETAIIIPAKFGILNVDQKDVVDIDKKVQEATNYFLKTGMMGIDDASGLSYTDRYGKQVDGALNESEKAFKYVLFPVIALLFTLLNVFLFKKTLWG